jgi:hypothetical protein
MKKGLVRAYDEIAGNQKPPKPEFEGFPGTLMFCGGFFHLQQVNIIHFNMLL